MNIWPIVQSHWAEIAGKVDEATPGSYDFIENAASSEASQSAQQLRRSHISR